MTEQTQQTTPQPDAVPARIQLDDFIEAVSRGVARALEAQDEVSGYALSQPNRPIGPIIVGIYVPLNPGGGGGAGPLPIPDEGPPIARR